VGTEADSETTLMGVRLLNRSGWGSGGILDVCGCVGFFFFSLVTLLRFTGERAEEEMLVVTLIIIV